MAKRFTFMMMMILIFGSVSFSQTTTATLGTVTASPGESVLVPLTVQNFNNVGAITFFIRYNPAMLSYIELTAFPSGMLAAATNDSTLAITWASITPVTPVTGTLLNIKFMYTGPGSSSLTFLTTMCEVGTTTGTTVPVLYTTGAVTPKMTNTQTATLEDHIATPGTVVNIPVKYAGFGSDIGAITQKVHYNQSSLTFVGLTVPSVGSLAGAIANASNGIVTITWTSSNLPAGSPINYPGNVIEMKFLYTGSTTTTVEFAPGCIITTAGGSNATVTYFNGTVSPGVISSHAVLGSITGAVQGQDYPMPLTLSGFTTNPGAITLNIGFDNAIVSYLGVTSPTYGAQTLVSQAGSMITIVYNNTAAPSVNGLFLNLMFKYNGPGDANVFFAAGCEFSTATSTIAVNYTDGTISPDTPPAKTATIAFVQDSIPGTEAPPMSVFFTGLPPSMGAVTMFIDYDNTKLTYIGVQGNIFGAIVNHDPVNPARINIAWTATAANTNINGPFLYLRFIYNGGAVNNCGAPVSFAPGCELATWAGAIVPVTWVNGGVNLRFKISGILRYDKTAVLPLSGFSIFVKDGAEPLPPAITPVPDDLWSAVTDANGYFEIYVPNGDYYLYAEGTAPWEDVDGADVTNIRRYIANLLPNTIVGDSLRQLAADINQDGLIDGADVTPLRRRIANLTPNPNYKAPDWMFQNPNVVVNCANIYNRNFLGILSGEVDGSYNP